MTPHIILGNMRVKGVRSLIWSRNNFLTRRA